MNNTATITEFLEAGGSRLRLFDMGRRVVKLSRQTFLQFERGEIPYPYPLQQQAWFGLLFCAPDNAEEPLIWFLRLPLDELGYLMPAARDDFLQRLLERAGKNLQAAREGQQLEHALKDNPYCFRPREDRLAMFHAKASKALKRPASKYYEHARQYFAGELGWDQWSFVGYQGIADLAARQDENDNAKRIAGALRLLPARPFEALCHCLENEPVSLALTQALLARLQETLQQAEPDLAIVTASIRGAALSRSTSTRRQLILATLEHPCAKEPDLLAAISGRAWELLQDSEICRLFLERLAENSLGQAFFNQCLGDLLFIPGMRESLLEQMRSPTRSTPLSQAIGALFSTLGQGE